MAVPKVPTFDDWSFELVNLATGTFTNLDQSIGAISGWVGRGASRHRLESAHLEIIDGTVGAIALSWAGIQLLRIVPYADPTHELWGYISKDSYAYSKSGLRDSIKVTVLPIEYLLHSRIVYETDNAAADPLAIATEAAPNNTGGDYAKTLVTACTHGRYPTGAPADTRDWAWGVLFVAAQVHDGLAVAPPMSLFAGFLDEAIDALGLTYEFDWELFVAVVAGVVQFNFTTDDAGGSDLTAGANRVIINDIGALVPTASRYFDREGMINALHGGTISTAVLDAPSVVTWGRWEGEVTTSIDEELQLVLDKSGIKEGSVFEFQASAASIQCQWMDEYEVGDTVKRNNVRLGIADNNEIIQAIEFSFPKRVLYTRIRWGNKEPGDKDKTRQGRYTPFPPVPPTLWSRHALLAYLYPTKLGDDIRIKDAAGVDKFEIDGATGDIYLHDRAEVRFYDNGNYVGFEAGALGGDQIWVLPLVDGGVGDALITSGAGVLSWGVPSSSFWERGDLRTGTGGPTGLFTRFPGDPVLIGADDTDSGNWISHTNVTKLDVAGQMRVGRAVYATANSLALWGMTGAIPTVHIVDETAAVGGAGGGKCVFDVWNANVAYARFDTDIAIASFVRGFWEVRDAAGAIGHSLNAVTGVVRLNTQRVITGDFIVDTQDHALSFGVDAGTDEIYCHAIPYLWPAADGAAGTVLTTSGANVLSWTAPVPAAHNLLSLQHGDTVVSAMTRGDLVVGTAGGWDDLAIGALSTHLESDGADLGWVVNLTMADDAWIGIGAAAERIIFDAAGDILVRGANLEIWDAGDFEVHSGAGATTVFGVDGATGVATWTGVGTIGPLGVDLLVDATADDLFLRATDDIFFQTGGAVIRWGITNAGTLFPSAPGYALGMAGFRCSNIYGTACDISNPTTFNAIAYSWPAADGAGGAVLSTNGAGTLTWVAAGAPPATPWTDTGVILHPTNARDVWGRAAGATWKLISATGAATFDGTTTWTGAGTVGITGDDLLVSATVDDLFLRAADDVRFQAGGAVIRWTINNAGSLFPQAAYNLGGGANRCANVYSVLGNFSGVVTSAVGYQVGGAAANRHALMGDGAKGVFRALQAADLGGHVHAVTWDNVATGTGTNHSHATSKTSQTGTFTAGVYRADIPVYDRQTGVPGPIIIGWVYGVEHYHIHGAGLHAFTYGATNGEAAHTHLYNEPNTPTGGPA